MIECPQHLLYSVSHTWVDIVDENACRARVGITLYLQEELPEILSVDLPMEGDELEIDNPCMHLHLAGDTITEVCSPLTGRVVAINHDVLDNPDLLHVAPYDHWIFEMEFDEKPELELLIEASRYVTHCETLSE